MLDTTTIPQQRRFEVPRYYDYEWNDCKFSVRQTGVRRLPLIKSLPYKDLSTFFSLIIKNQSPDDKELNFKWSISEKDGELVFEGLASLTVTKHETIKVELNNKRFDFPGIYFLTLHLSDLDEPTMIEFNIPEVLDTVINSIGIKVGIGAIGARIGIGLTLLIQRLMP